MKKKDRFSERDCGEYNIYISYAKTKKKDRKRFFGAACNKNIILIERQENIYIYYVYSIDKKKR